MQKSHSFQDSFVLQMQGSKQKYKLDTVPKCIRHTATVKKEPRTEKFIVTHFQIL